VEWDNLPGDAVYFHRVVGSEGDRHHVGHSFYSCSGVQTFSNLNLDTAPMVTCIPGPCSPPVSSYRAFSYSAGSIDGPFTTVNGLFPLTTRAEGQVTFRNYPGCGTAAGIGWTATKP
jgi:hypothetical protein